MTQTALTVLVVDREPPALQRWLEATGGEAPRADAPLRLLASTCITGALATVASAPVDVILLDLPHPGAGGLDAVRRLHDAAPSLPIVAVAAPDGEELAYAAVQAGAQDHVVRGVDDARVMRRAIRHAVTRAARVRARDQVLAIVSHDLRNPLSAIAMCAAALRDDGHAPRERERLVTTIQNSVEWTQRLLGDLLDIASIEAGRLSIDVRPVDPVIVISRALDLFELTAAEQSIRLAHDLPDVLPAIAGDQQRILQVLANLISNAIRFTPPHGTITVGAAEADGAVVFTVADTGSGISSDAAGHIFDWFWRATHERTGRGTGLGLAIAKGIVEAHGGRIRVTSAPRAGSTFSFTVPLAVSAAPSACAAPSAETRSSSRGRTRTFGT